LECHPIFSNPYYHKLVVRTTYNGNGQRVKKVVSGTTTVFHYSLLGQLIAESDGSGATTAEYVYITSTPLAKIDSTGTNYIHNDHLGTPVAMTDATGAKVWEIATKPFGDGATITGTATLNLRFPGQYYDAETGQNYNLNRDYNPVVGRYIESDPLGIQEGTNHIYNYAKMNPINLTDPSGLIVPPALKPGGDCLECDEWLILQCMMRKPATPNSALACAKCIFTYNPYTKQYDPISCSQCFATLTMHVVDCYKEVCKKGKRDKCGKCVF
jgi:RHS repeat-associated protein